MMKLNNIYDKKYIQTETNISNTINTVNIM